MKFARSGTPDPKDKKVIDKSLTRIPNLSFGYSSQ